MPRLFTVGDLILRGARRADKEGDEHVDHAEWKAILSEVVGELYEMAIDAGLRTVEAVDTITPDGSTTAWDLPNRHYETLAVVPVRAGGDRGRPLVEVAAQELPELAAANGDENGEARFYAIAGAQISLLRKPRAGSTTYEHSYIVQPPDLSVAEDTVQVDLFSPAGEAFVGWALAVFGRDKGETNLQTAWQMRAGAAERFQAWAQKQRSNYAPKQTFSAPRTSRPPWGRRW